MWCKPMWRNVVQSMHCHRLDCNRLDWNDSIVPIRLDRFDCTGGGATGRRRRAATRRRRGGDARHRGGKAALVPRSKNPSVLQTLFGENTKCKRSLGNQKTFPEAAPRPPPGAPPRRRRPQGLRSGHRLWGRAAGRGPPPARGVRPQIAGAAKGVTARGVAF